MLSALFMVKISADLFYTAMQNSYVSGKLCSLIVRISRLKCTVRTGHIILTI